MRRLREWVIHGTRGERMRNEGGMRDREVEGRKKGR